MSTELSSIGFGKAFVGPCSTVAELQARRAAITMLGAELAELPQIECPVTNRFADGVYIREMFAPAGTRVIGKIHTTQFFNILVSGQCLIATTEGIIHIRAPYTFVSEPGSQKCGYCLTDVVWQTVHPTESKDVDAIVAGLTVDCYEDLETDFAMNKLIGELTCQ